MVEAPSSWPRHTAGRCYLLLLPILQRSSRLKGRLSKWAGGSGIGTAAGTPPGGVGGCCCMQNSRATPARHRGAGQRCSREWWCSLSRWRVAARRGRGTHPQSSSCAQDRPLLDVPVMRQRGGPGAMMLLSLLLLLPHWRLQAGCWFHSLLLSARQETETLGKGLPRPRSSKPCR